MNLYDSVKIKFAVMFHVGIGSVITVTITVLFIPAVKQFLFRQHLHDINVTN
jgi:hypothetical protein